jgi:hypothetical protein
MDQLVQLCKPNKKVRSEKMVDPQTKHPRLLLVMLASVGILDLDIWKVQGFFFFFTAVTIICTGL